MDQKRLKYMKKEVLDQKNKCFLKASGKLVVIWKIRTVLKSSGKLAFIWKNPDSFEIIRKIGSHLERSGQF